MDRIPFQPYDFFGYLASGFLVLVGMSLTIGFPPVFGREFNVLESVALLMAAYVAGQLVATPSKALLGDGLVDKILGRPSANLLRENGAPLVRRLLFPGFYAPLPPAAQRTVLEKAKAEGVSEPGEDLFLLVRYSPATLQNAELMTRLNAFLNQYGFSRNLRFASLLVGIAMLVAARVLPDRDPNLWKYGLTILVAGVLLLYRYLKFFRQYSYELFNTYGRSK